VGIEFEMNTFATELSRLRRAVHSQYKEPAFVPYQICLDILKMKAHDSKIAANNFDLFTPRLAMVPKRR
jgi:hypothetical protein